MNEFVAVGKNIGGISIDELYKLGFPNMVDKLSPEIGQYFGPRPKVYGMYFCPPPGPNTNTALDTYSLHDYRTGAYHLLTLASRCQYHGSLSDGRQGEFRREPANRHREG